MDADTVLSLRKQAAELLDSIDGPVAKLDTLLLTLQTRARRLRGTIATYQMLTAPTMEDVDANALREAARHIRLELETLDQDWADVFGHVHLVRAVLPKEDPDPNWADAGRRRVQEELKCRARAIASAAVPEE